MLRRIARPDPILQVPANYVLPDIPESLIANTMNKGGVKRARVNKRSVDDYYVHVSDLMNVSAERAFCARQHVLTLAEQSDEFVGSLTPGMELLYASGSFIQDFITQKFIQRSPYGHTVWGDWQCNCGSLVVSHSLRPSRSTSKRCSGCGGLPLHYKEISLRLDRYRLVGHPDLILLWNRTLVTYEIKSLDRQTVPFDTLDAPLGDHTIQNTFYYWMMRAMHADGSLPYPPSSKLRYLYAYRGTDKLFTRTIYKEFEKVASASARIKPMIDKAAGLIASIERGTLPVRICKGPNDARAKACSKCVSCFSRKQAKLPPDVLRRIGHIADGDRHRHTEIGR